MANTGKIERAAVRAVEEYLDKCPKLVPDIDWKGNDPIWDGYVTVYKNESHSNKTFFARIPVQVKGSTVAKGNTFSIGREHIEAYKSERGTAFFMVQENEDSNKILYALLSTKEIDNLLMEYPEGNVKIPLLEMPSDPLVFEDKLYAFAASRNNEKVENTSPKEITKLVKGFEGLRGHLNEIKDISARMELESSLDFIKNLKDESAEEKGTIGWRDKFYYHSRKAIDLSINNIEGHDFVYLQHYLGMYLADQKQYHLAEDYYYDSLKKYRNHLKVFPSTINLFNVAAALNNLGELHRVLTHYDEAEEEYKESLKIFRELAKNNREAYIGDAATILNNLAALHYNLTRYDESEKEHKEALEIRLELAKTNRDAYIGDVAMTLNNLAILHKILTRHEEAEEEYKEALEIYRELAETNRDAYIGYVATTLTNLGNLHNDLNRKDEAEKEYKEALEIRRELAKTNRDAYIGDVALSLICMGDLHRALTRYDEADKELKEALIILRELAETNRDAYIGYVAMTLNSLGLLHNGLTRYDEAEKEYNESQEIYRELVKTNRDAYIANVALTLVNFAALQAVTNRKAEAQKTAEEALGIYKELANSYPQRWGKDVENTERLLEILSE